MIISGILLLAGVYLSGYVVWWLILLGTHFFSSVCSSPVGVSQTRFAILVPAHDEELLIPRLLESIQSQDYPREKFGTIVVADNCSDGTAEAARGHGASVLERVDDENRGKGYAIKWALEKIDLDQYDAVLILDADCFISNNVLASLDGTLGEAKAIQCYSGVGNPDDSWFTHLLDVSRTINNDIYSRAKRRLGLSCQLIGTGMCFGTQILRKYGWDALTVGEDCEYFAKLIENGETVGFDWNAKVYHQESLSLRQATSQRMRWSSGRLAVAKRYGFALLRAGIKELNVVKFDAGLSLILPNPSLGMNATLLCLAVALLGSGGQIDAFTIWFVLLAAIQFAVFIVGVFYTRNRLKKLLAVLIAPVFLVWKLVIDALSVLGVGRKKWIRTERKL